MTTPVGVFLNFILAVLIELGYIDDTAVCKQ